MSEEVCDIGYINPERKHALISIKAPSLNSCHCSWQRNMAQFAITIESAIVLRAKLNAFLAQHGVTFQ
jgi:hypothetical protein